MKTNLFQLSLLFLLCTSVLCGCANDDEQILSTDGSTLTVHATADGFASADGADTRASEDGYTTTFAEGNRIGVFAVKGGQVITDCNNVPLTYNGTNWEGTVYYYTDARYFAYYPYDASMSDKTSVERIVDAFTPQPDQSTHVNYTKSDLMTADFVYPSDKTLRFSFAHKMSLIEISLPVQKYKTSDGYVYSSPVIDATFNITPGSNSPTITPYNMGGGVYRYIVSGNDYHTVKGEFRTGDGKIIEYNRNDLYLYAGCYKRLNVSYDGASEEPQERDLAIGDYYCSGGDICPGDAPNPPSEYCIGIVFSTDVSRIDQAAANALKDKGVETPHGLVMALTNTEGCRWGEEWRDEPEGPFKDNTTTLKQQYNNVNGYAETHWIIDTYKDEGSKLRDTYTAFYYASLYGTEESTAKYAAPINTTGWFIPSMGQWWDILSNLGGRKDDLEKFRESESPAAYIPAVGDWAIGSMNDYLKKIIDTDKFSRDNYFWSSSEFDGKYAYRMYFDYEGQLCLSYINKSTTDPKHKVRCVLAF